MLLAVQRAYSARRGNHAAITLPPLKSSQTLYARLAG